MPGLPGAALASKAQRRVARIELRFEVHTAPQLATKFVRARYSEARQSQFRAKNLR